MANPHCAVSVAALAVSLGFVAAGCDKPGRAAPADAATAQPAVAEIADDPNVLVSDRPTSELSLDHRRLGDASEAGNKPFGEFTSFPYRYGVTNGRITSMTCPGDRLRTMDVEPTGVGLQMRLGKADDIITARNGFILYWFAKKRAAEVANGEIRWFAVYR